MKRFIYDGCTLTIVDREDYYNELTSSTWNFTNPNSNTDDKGYLKSSSLGLLHRYALCLSNMLHISDNIELRFSVPQEAMDLADPRSRQYYENRPELKRYMDKLKRDAGQPVVRKPERNELCPCGSGKKFKKCCIGKGIYD